VFLREHLFKNLNFLLSTTGKMRGGEERLYEGNMGVTLARNFFYFQQLLSLVKIHLTHGEMSSNHNKNKNV
jgi:hypothetical protein